MVPVLIDPCEIPQVILAEFRLTNYMINFKNENVLQTNQNIKHIKIYLKL